MSRNELIKLTTTQSRTLSDLINKFLNGEVVNIDNYNNRVINRLIELQLFNPDTCFPTEKAAKIYLKNLKRDTVLRNKNGERISLYKKCNEGWEFIWFLTRGKLGGGIVTYMDLLMEYKIE